MIRTSILVAAFAGVACFAQAQDRPQVQELDTNGDGVVTKSEFFSAVSPELAGARDVLFRDRDRNGDGVLSEADTQRRRSTPQPRSAGAARAPVRDADRDGDGAVSLQEFTRALPAGLKPFAAVMFPKHDTDGDGLVSGPEL